MKLHQAEARLIELLDAAGKMELKLAIHEETWNQFQGNNDSLPDYLIEDEQDLRGPFQNVLECIHLASIVVIELKRLPVFLKQFFLKFGKVFDSQKAARDFDLDLDGIGGLYNKYLSDLRAYLSAIGIMHDNAQYIKAAGIEYLERILWNTATIIKSGGFNISCETDVTNSVRQFVYTVFPTSINAQSKFFKAMKCYKPDVLVPELSCTIEYKYATTIAKLKSTVASIHEDTKGYTGDDDYNLFYAVFYVKGDLCGKKRFQEIWQESQFPDNWSGIYTVGH